MYWTCSVPQSNCDNLHISYVFRMPLQTRWYVFIVKAGAHSHPLCIVVVHCESKEYVILLDSIESGWPNQIVDFECLHTRLSEINILCKVMRTHIWVHVHAHTYFYTFSLIRLLNRGHESTFFHSQYNFGLHLHSELEIYSNLPN